MTHDSTDKTALANSPSCTFYVTAPVGLQGYLAKELEALGAARVQQAGAGVRADGPLRLGYLACLWCRTANRVLLPLADVQTPSDTALYEAVGDIDWSLHLGEKDTLAVDAFLSQSNITHSHYAALKVKDAIVDQFRHRVGQRPSVDRERPSIRVNVYIHKNRARIALDLSGQSLHRRGYRQAAGPAPLKENLAAALLMAMDWPGRVERGEGLVDPMCGSGTLLLEAAMMAANQAPGLGRDYFGFLGWRQHDASLWASIVAEAKAAKIAVTVALVGHDRSPEAIRQANQNARIAGLADCVDFSKQALGDDAGASQAKPCDRGLVISNPPYGARLELPRHFYQDLGLALSRDYAGWDCALFVANTTPVEKTGLPLKSTLAVRNGAIDCALYSGHIPATSHRARTKRETQRTPARVAESRQVAIGIQPAVPAGATAASRASTTAQSSAQVDTSSLVNRLAKNRRSLKSWLKRDAVHAFRLYDADIPEFAFAIDVYEADQRHLVVQEYQPPATVNRAMAEARRQAVYAALPGALDSDVNHMHIIGTRLRSILRTTSILACSLIIVNCVGILQRMHMASDF